MKRDVTSCRKLNESRGLKSLWSGLGEAPARGPKGAGAPLAALGLQYFWIFLITTIFDKTLLYIKSIFEVYLYLVISSDLPLYYNIDERYNWF